MKPSAGPARSTAAHARRLADFDPLVAYLRSCAILDAPADRSAADAEVVAALTARQRQRFARGLVDLAVASLAAARDAGDSLPLPGTVVAPERCLDEIERLRREFAASDVGDGRRTRAAARLGRELVLARTARRRARRCLRLALQLEPRSEEAALATAWLRASASSAAPARRRLGELAERTKLARLRARAWVVLAGVDLRRGADRAALGSLLRSLEASPNEPEALARVALAHLRLGEEVEATSALERLAKVSSDGAEAAWAFLVSPASGFPRLFAASAQARAALVRSHPEVATRLLEAVQRPAPRRGPRGFGDPKRFLAALRTRLRVPFAALVTQRDGWSVLALSTAASYGVTPARVVEICASGGPGGAIHRARADGAVAIALRARGAPGEFLRPEARGAVAAPLAEASPPPTYLLLESDRVLALDPDEIAGLGELASLYACAARDRAGARPEAAE